MKQRLLLVSLLCCSESDHVHVQTLDLNSEQMVSQCCLMKSLERAVELLQVLMSARHDCTDLCQTKSVTPPPQPARLQQPTMPTSVAFRRVLQRHPLLAVFLFPPVFERACGRWGSHVLVTTEKKLICN